MQYYIVDNSEIYTNADFNNLFPLFDESEDGDFCEWYLDNTFHKSIHEIAYISACYYDSETHKILNPEKAVYIK